MDKDFMRIVEGLAMSSPMLILPFILGIGVTLAASLVVPDVNQESYGDNFESVLVELEEETRDITDSESNCQCGQIHEEEYIVHEPGIEIHPVKLIAIFSILYEQNFDRVSRGEVKDFTDYFWKVEYRTIATTSANECSDCDYDEETGECPVYYYDCPITTITDYTTYTEFSFDEALDNLAAAGKISHSQITDIQNLYKLESGGEYSHSYRPGAVGSGGFIWPTPSRNITSPFGGRIDPITGVAGAFHNGTDIGGVNPGVYGDPIWAISDGEVLFADYNGSFGLVISIKHPNGLVSYYAHLDRIDYKIRPGVEVKQGQEIGNMGNTGRSSGVHLHFELRSEDTPIDAMSYY